MIARCCASVGHVTGNRNLTSFEKKSKLSLVSLFLNRASLWIFPLLGWCNRKATRLYSTANCIYKRATPRVFFTLTAAERISFEADEAELWKLSLFAVSQPNSLTTSNLQLALTSGFICFVCEPPLKSPDHREAAGAATLNPPTFFNAATFISASIGEIHDSVRTLGLVRPVICATNLRHYRVSFLLLSRR